MKKWSPLEAVFFGAFLFWSAAGLIFTLGRISPETVAHGHLAPWLVRFIDFCLEQGDPILILLAFANTHLQAARQWTSTIARRWGLVVIVSALAVETLGTLTGFPFGGYHYTHGFGPMVGVVPLTIPLAWHVVVTNALFVVRSLAPYCPRTMEAALAALLCTVYDFILEPFATGAKHYWIWVHGTIPLQNYVAWFMISGLLVRLFAPTISTRFRSDPRPVSILFVTVLIFLAGEW